MSPHPLREYLEEIPIYQLIVRITLLRTILEDLNHYNTLKAFERDLDRYLSAHLTIYFENSFGPPLLGDIPRYLVYRFHAFGTPFDEEHLDDQTSGDNTPSPDHSSRQ